MRYSIPSVLTRIAALFAILNCATVCPAEWTADGATDTPAPPVLQGSPEGQRTLADLEARIAELERARQAEQAQTPSSVFASSRFSAPADGSATDPAVRTAQEQGPSANGYDESGELIRAWIGQIQDPAITTVQQQTGPTTTKKHWFDRMSLRGYTQFRINEVPWYEQGGALPQNPNDSSIGPNQNFLIRRARLVFSGDVSEHMYIYIQPDFAASVPGSTDAIDFAQLRDCYSDIYFDHDKVHRLRVGLSKVPYGWDILQSSSNRLCLDRTDALTTAAPGERDLGVIYYYTPKFAQELYKYVLEKGLKGSGNYGLLGVGVYNGQGVALREQNENLHTALRLAVPWQFPNEQVVELGAQAYSGKYVVLTSAIRPLGVGPAVAPTVDASGYVDERVGGTLVVYPQPLGFQAEWNVGHGPMLNDAQTAVVNAPLTGGYGMLFLRHPTDCWGTLFPFIRYQRYEGGYKGQRNAPNTLVNEWEMGLEWQFNPQMELTAEYTFTNRTNTNALATGTSYGQFLGDIVRIQFQVNY